MLLSYWKDENKKTDNVSPVPACSRGKKRDHKTCATNILVYECALYNRDIRWRKIPRGGGKNL